MEDVTPLLVQLRLDHAQKYAKSLLERTLKLGDEYKKEQRQDFVDVQK
jgi:hypothetical protein